MHNRNQKPKIPLYFYPDKQAIFILTFAMLTPIYEFVILCVWFLPSTIDFPVAQVILHEIKLLKLHAHLMAVKPTSCIECDKDTTRDHKWQISTFVGALRCPMPPSTSLTTCLDCLRMDILLGRERLPCPKATPLLSLLGVQCP